MKLLRLGLIYVFVSAIVLQSSVFAGQTLLPPSKLLQIKQTIESSPSQLLLQYELPDSGICVEVYLAELTLIISSDTSIHGGLMLEVSPASVSWEGSDIVQVGDIAEHHDELKAIKPFKSGVGVAVTINVHEIVSAWYSGALENRGLVISILGSGGSTLSYSDENDSGVLRIVCGK